MYNYRLLYTPPTRRNPKENYDVVVAASYVNKDGVQVEEVLNPFPVELTGESTDSIVEKLKNIITDLAKNPTPLTQKNVFVLTEEDDDDFFLEEEEDEIEDVLSFIDRDRE